METARHSTPKIRGAIHGTLFFASLVLVNAGLSSLTWPWYLVLPVLVYAAIVLAILPLRRTSPRLAIGRLGGWPAAYAAGLARTAAGVLAGFHVLFQPDANELARRLPLDWGGSVLLAGACFCLVNAAAEEVIFRGILWEVISEEWNQAAALGVTSVLFGIGHLHGYPPGPLGAVMAGAYGVTLGVLRWWTGGLGLALLCHVAADATILCILTAAEC